jgi:30S ribosomal protein S17
MARGKAKILVGVVTSDKMDKTVSVDVVRIETHPKYKKPIKKLSTFKAHDEKNECKVGDKVSIIETRPLSRTKRWRVTEILESAAIIIEKENAGEELEEGGKQE